jgi:hypothetical protein
VQRLVALFLFASCGGSQTPASKSADNCTKVAAHLVQLAMEDNETTERPPDIDGVEQEFIRQCKGNPWSEARRSCLLAAGSQDATLQCPLE